MIRWRWKNESGASTVETALACTILVTLVVGIVQISQGLYAYHYIAEAARMGTRYAIVRGSSCSGFGSACPAGATDIQNYVKGLGFPGINTSDMTVTATWPTTGSTCTPSSSPCNNPGNLVKVRVQYQLPLSIPYVTNVNLNMTSTSQMVISQ
jgi:Flp pilus assembly protein TadG